MKCYEYYSDIYFFDVFRNNDYLIYTKYRIHTVLVNLKKRL